MEFSSACVDVLTLGLTSSSCCKDRGSTPFFKAKGNIFSKIAGGLDASKTFIDIYHKLRQILPRDKGAYDKSCSLKKLEIMQDYVDTLNC